jgi:hypothetical protein
MSKCPGAAELYFKRASFPVFQSVVANPVSKIALASKCSSMIDEWRLQEAVLG